MGWLSVTVLIITLAIIGFLIWYVWYVYSKFVKVDDKALATDVTVEEVKTSLITTGAKINTSLKQHDLKIAHVQEKQAMADINLTTLDKRMQTSIDRIGNSLSTVDGQVADNTKNINKNAELLIAYDTRLSKYVVLTEDMAEKLDTHEYQLVTQEDDIQKLMIDNTEQEQAISDLSKRLADRDVALTTQKMCVDDICLTGSQLKGLLSVIEPNNLDKRVQLLAVAYYNALRDNNNYAVTTNEDVYDGRIKRHMQIMGFFSDGLEKVYRDDPYIYSELKKIVMQTIPSDKRFQNGDILYTLDNFMKTTKPTVQNDQQLTLFEWEKQQSNGILPPNSIIAKTFASLNPSDNFYPPNAPYIPTSINIPRGASDMIDIIPGSETFRKMFEEAKRSTEHLNA
jgi:hypothetical protein